MSFPPNAAGRNEENCACTTPQQKISRQKRNFGEVLAKKKRDRDGIGGEDGAECSSEDAGKAKEKGNQVASQERPVQGVVWVIGRLRDLGLVSA